MSDSLKYDAFDTSEAENEIRYQTICSIVIVDDLIWTKTSADDVLECVEDVLNSEYSSLIKFFLILLSELAWENVFI